MMPAARQGPPPVTIDAVVQLLRDDKMRGFRIDVETDSMVEADQAKERADVTAFVQALGGFFKEFGPIVQQMPPLAPMVSELLQFSVRRFKVGAQLEETIEKAMEQVQQKLDNPPPPQPSPDEQIKLETAQVKGKAETDRVQLEGNIASMEANFRQQEMVMEQRAKDQEAAFKAQESKMDMILKLLEHRQEGERMAREEERDVLQHERAKEMIEHKAKEAKKPKGNE